MKSPVVGSVINISLFGCAANERHPDAQRVMLLSLAHGSECKYPSDVTGGQGNFISG